MLLLNEDNHLKEQKNQYIPNPKIKPLSRLLPPKKLHPLQSSIYALGALSCGTSRTGRCSQGTAVYIGDGLFLTAGHCCRIAEGEDWSGLLLHVVHTPAEEVDFTKLALAKDLSSHRVEVVAFLDPEIHVWSREHMPSWYYTRLAKDIALLRITSSNSSRIPSNQAAALPGLVTHEQINCTFLGYNQSLANPYKSAAQETYPSTVDAVKLEEACADLRPQRLSIAEGEGMFSDMGKTRPRIYHNRGRTAEVVSYNISTVRGAAGSAITGSVPIAGNRHAAENPRLIGIHVGAVLGKNSDNKQKSRAFPETVSVGVNLASDEFHGFAEKEIVPRLKDERLKREWTAFLRQVRNVEAKWFIDEDREEGSSGPGGLAVWFE